MSKAVIFFAEGTEECEALLPLDLLRRAGVDVVLASVTNALTVVSSHGVRILADALANDVDYTKVDMLVLPGGMPGTVRLGECRIFAAGQACGGDLCRAEHSQPNGSARGKNRDCARRFPRQADRRYCRGRGGCGGWKSDYLLRIGRCAAVCACACAPPCGCGGGRAHPRGSGIYALKSSARVRFWQKRYTQLVFMGAIFTVEKDDWRLFNEVESLKDQSFNPTSGAEIFSKAPRLKKCIFCWDEIDQTNNSIWFIPEDISCCICKNCHDDFKEMFRWKDLDGWDIDWSIEP